MATRRVILHVYLYFMYMLLFWQEMTIPVYALLQQDKSKDHILTGIVIKGLQGHITSTLQHTNDLGLRLRLYTQRLTAVLAIF